MRICATCGEVYDDSARVCGLDGTVLTSWEENTRLPFGIEDVVTDAGIHDAIRAEVADRGDDARKTTPMARLRADDPKQSGGVAYAVTDPQLEAVRHHPRVADAISRVAARHAEVARSPSRSRPLTRWAQRTEKASFIATSNRPTST